MPSSGTPTVPPIPLKVPKDSRLSTPSSIPHKPRWATVVEGAEHIGGGVNPRTIREWISEGLIPGYRFGKRFVRIDLNDLDALAQRIPAAGTMPEGWPAE